MLIFQNWNGPVVTFFRQFMRPEAIPNTWGDAVDPNTIRGTPPNLNTNLLTYDGNSKPFDATLRKNVQVQTTTFWQGSPTSSRTQVFNAGTSIGLTQITIDGIRSSDQKVVHTIIRTIQ